MESSGVVVRDSVEAEGCGEGSCGQEKGYENGVHDYGDGAV